MAFVQSQIPEDQQNQFAQQGDTTPNPLAMVPPQAGGSSGQGGGGQPAAPGVGTSTQFGSGASRLSDYLSANQDQVQGMANDIAGNFSSSFGGVKDSVTNAGQTFGQQVQNSYTPTDPTNLAAVQQDPIAASKDPAALAKFRSQMTSTYSGPQSFEASDPYMNAQKNVQDAVSKSDMVKTYPGLSNYLQSYVEKNATPGQNTLDTVLLQGNLPAYNTIKDSTTPYAGLNDYLSQVSGQQAQGITQAQQAAPAARQAASDVYSGIANPFVSGLNEEYTGATKKSTDYNTMLNSIAGKISNSDLSQLTPEEQSLIGFNPQILPLIQKYGTIFQSQAQNNPLTPSKFFTQGPQAQTPSPENVVNQDQISMWQALSQLGGGQSPTGLNFEMPTAANPVPGQQGGLPGELPAYNNMGVLGQINSSYGPMYQQLLANGFQGVNPAETQKIMEYMNQLNAVSSAGQPSSQPTTPPPAPGSQGDLGMGFHWDQNTGSWLPTIPWGNTMGSDGTNQAGQSTGGTPISGGTTSSGGHQWLSQGYQP